ncbi:MAG: hypothetical protein IJB59_09425 [Oscillospiraceae bacterium]|nr:hypothetical protein [Oscillospiraceae bacterium]
MAKITMQQYEELKEAYETDDQQFAEKLEEYTGITRRALPQKLLIDANALREEISSLTMVITGLRFGKGVLYEYVKEYKKSVLKIVDEAATVDAVEVVHARWEEIGVADYKCSRCGFRFTSADPISMFQYCRCGAKMDGGNEDECV